MGMNGSRHIGQLSTPFRGTLNSTYSELTTSSQYVHIPSPNMHLLLFHQLIQQLIHSVAKPETWGLSLIPPSLNPTCVLNQYQVLSILFPYSFPFYPLIPNFSGLCSNISTFLRLGHELLFQVLL